MFILVESIFESYGFIGSSGNKTLDNVALQLIKKIKLFPKAGFEAKNKIFNFLIPLNFDLNQN